MRRRADRAIRYRLPQAVTYHAAVEVVTGALWVLTAVAFAYFGIHYTTRWYEHGWRPKDDGFGPAMVSRSEAVEDQPWNVAFVLAMIVYTGTLAAVGKGLTTTEPVAVEESVTVA